MMKALVFHQHGDLDQVEVIEAPKPTAGPGEVLVEIKAAALNQLDLWVLKGWPGLQLKLPHIMGSDGAGIIADIGPGVTDFEVGDPVAINPTLSCGECHFCQTGRDNMCGQFALFGEHVPGFYTQFAVVPTRNLLRIPATAADHVGFAETAAASLVYVTAWHSLIERGRLLAGESVLIVGAGGGVNTAAIQIARLAGAGPIYVVGSTDEKLSAARDLGADVTINRREVDWGKELFRATERQGVDVVVDNVGAATFQASLRALKKGGRLLTVGNTSGPKFEIDNRYIFGKHLSIIGSTMGTISDYARVMELIFEGKLKAVVDSTYPLQDGKLALERLQKGDFSGKLVLQP